jgi:hypothetical protein
MGGVVTMDLKGDVHVGVYLSWIWMWLPQEGSETSSTSKFFKVQVKYKWSISEVRVKYALLKSRFFPLRWPCGRLGGVGVGGCKGVHFVSTDPPGKLNSWIVEGLKKTFRVERSFRLLHYCYSKPMRSAPYIWVNVFILF